MYFKTSGFQIMNLGLNIGLPVSRHMLSNTQPYVVLQLPVFLLIIILKN